ncbi:MAG: ATP-binding cassette domain-containing protein [Oscillospiraceae bacterium]
MRDRPPHDLSGGEKKRVSIADIIAMEPEVIVFDEPTVSLDPENLSRFEDLLAQLKEEGRTVLISTRCGFCLPLGRPGCPAPKGPD